MKALAIIVNIFLPGIGTLIVKKWGEGIAQIILGLIGIALSATVVFSIVGIPLLVGVWIWAIVSSALANPEPVQITIKHE